SKLVRMVIPIMSVLGTVMAPKIIGYIKNKDKDKIYDTMDKFINFNIIMGIPATFLMIYLSKDIILLISGDKFIYSNLTMKIISVIIIFIPAGTFFGGQLLLPNDKEKLVFKVAITGMVFNVIFNFILIPKFSIAGAAFATVFTEILICLYRGYEVKKIYPDYIFFSKERLNYMRLGLGAFLCVFLLKNMAMKNSLYNIIFFSSIYGVIYFGGLFFLKDKNINIILEKIKAKKEKKL
ncbi:MAG: polysaccharide biosynthesis C-terminal domain-containing protein, partial [Bacilli bacterium]